MFDRIKSRVKHQSSGEEAYLSYHDVRVMREDLEVLRDGWLNDNVIAFWQEYLEREKLVDYPSSRISLLRPTMVLMLMQTPDPRNLRDVLPQLMQCTHIFLPINDAHDAGVADGGTHWSLLVASVIDGTAFHYDSMSPTNYAYGAHACKQLSIFLNRRFEYMNLPESPKQYNSSDCGVFVCMTMEHLLLRRLLNVNSKEKVTMSMRNFEIRASVCRKEMLRVIDGFRAEGEKKRSHEVSRGPSPRPKNRASRSPPRIE